VTDGLADASKGERGRSSPVRSIAVAFTSTIEF
jgi:hypothetical protein